MKLGDIEDCSECPMSLTIGSVLKKDNGNELKT